MKELKFTCPKCNTHRIEEVMVNVILSTVISEIYEHEDSVDIDYSDLRSTDYGEVTHYQCVACGTRIKDGKTPIRSYDELGEWLKENCSQTEE